MLGKELRGICWTLKAVWNSSFFTSHFILDPFHHLFHLFTLATWQGHCLPLDCYKIWMLWGLKLLVCFCVILGLLAGEPWFPHSSVLFFFTNLVWHVCFPCCLVALAAPILVNATCRKPRGDSGRKENILCKLLQCRVRPRANASPQKRQKPWHAKTGLFWSFQSRWPMVQSRGSQCFCAWCLPSPTGHRGEGGEALLKDFLFGLSGECYFFMGMTWCFCSWYLPYGQAATTSAVGMGNAGSLMTLQLHVTFLTFPTS